jgi:hypothetical protein
MNDARKIMLRVMLGALALAALCAVAALILPGSELWRLAGTGLIAAVAAAFLAALGRWAENPLTRVAGLMGMGVCVGLFVGACVLVWLPRGAGRWEELLGMSLFNLAGCGLPCAVLLSFLNKPGGRIAALGGAGVLALTWASFQALISYEVLLNPVAMWTVLEKWSVTNLLFAGAGLLTVVCLSGWGTPRADGGRTDWLKVLTVLGVGGAALGLGMGVYGAWWSIGGNPWPIVAGYMLGVVGAAAQPAIRMQVPGAPWLRFVFLGSLAFGAVMTASATYIEDDPTAGLGPARLAIASTVIAACAGLAIVVLRRLGQRRSVELAKTEFAVVNVECPRCGRRFGVDTGPGGALCPGCKLHMRVQVSAARCGACGYDLKDLAGDRCPECGAGLSPADLARAAPGA